MATSVQSPLPGIEKHRVSYSEREFQDPDFTSKPAETPARSGPATKIAALTSSDVRVLRPDEYKQAALSLAEAFADDDIARYFTHTPDSIHRTDAQRWDLHVRILEYIVYAHILNGVALTAGPNYGCVALWMPPGKNIDDWVTIMRSGQWRLYYQLSNEGKARYFDEFFPLLHQTKLNVLRERDEHSWYLVYIGTRPAAQKMGLARKVIGHMTAVADAEGRAAYLESSHAANLPFYRRMGFEVCKKVYLQRHHEPLELDIMVREPVARKGLATE